MGNLASYEVYSVLKLHKVDQNSIVSDELMKELFQSLARSSYDQCLDLEKGFGLLDGILKTIKVPTSSEEVRGCLLEEMKEEQQRISFKDFQTVLHRIIPTSKLTAENQKNRDQNSTFLCTTTSNTFLINSDGDVIEIGGKAYHPRKVLGIKNIVAISCGGDHCAMLDCHGRVWTMGDNSVGQLGIGKSLNHSNSPRRLIKGTGDCEFPLIDKISCGFSFTYFIDNIGKVWNCGSNNFYQLGDNESKICFRPTNIDFPSPALQISCGECHTIILLEKNVVLRAGSLKDKTYHSLTFQKVQLSSSMENVTSLASGRNFYALLAGGCVYVQGKIQEIPDILYPSLTCLYKKKNIRSIICQREVLYCTTLGGKTGVIGTSHLEVQSKPSTLSFIASLPSANRISSGFGSHTVIEDISGRIWGFGQNALNQISNEAIYCHTDLISLHEDVILPLSYTLLIDGIRERNAVIALHDPSGTYRERLTSCIGPDDLMTIDIVELIVHEFEHEVSGMYEVLHILFDLMNSPVPIEAIDKISKEPCTVETLTLFLRKYLIPSKLSPEISLTTQWDYYYSSIEKTVIARFGSASYCCSRNGDVSMINFPEVTKIKGLRDVVCTSATIEAIYFVTYSGEVYTITGRGYQQSKQIEKIPTENPISSVFCAAHYACILDCENKLWQISPTREVREIELPPGRPITGIFCGPSHDFLIRDDGSVWGRGVNKFGELGTGDMLPRKEFSLIFKKSNVMSISCGYHHTLLLLNDGSVFGCGSNTSFQLGMEDLFPGSSTPIRISAVKNIRSITCQHNSSFCVTKEGELLTFGYQWNGNTTAEPLVIGGIDNVSFVTRSHDWPIYQVAQDRFDNLWILNPKHKHDTLQFRLLPDSTELCGNYIRKGIKSARK